MGYDKLPGRCSHGKFRDIIGIHMSCIAISNTRIERAFRNQDISGSGMVFLEIDGDIVDRQLAPGEVLKVDTGNVVAFERSVNYEVETVKGLGNIFFGGEGLFLTKLTGPGRVILQTQNIADFAGRIARFIPTSGK